MAFHDRHGGKTLIYAKFVPIVRTFAPFIAGVAKMPYFRFLSFNIFGGLGWVILMTVSGYFMGQIPLVRRHFEKIVILIVLVSVIASTPPDPALTNDLTPDDLSTRRKLAKTQSESSTNKPADVSLVQQARSR